MEIKLLQQPDSTIARVTLNAGEEIVAEAGAMVAMSGNLQASTTLRQGKGGGISADSNEWLLESRYFSAYFDRQHRKIHCF
jgi:uncharacterized protein (AIM24 family)